MIYEERYKRALQDIINMLENFDLFYLGNRRLTGELLEAIKERIEKEHILVKGEEK